MTQIKNNPEGAAPTEIRRLVAPSNNPKHNTLCEQVAHNGSTNSKEDFDAIVTVIRGVDTEQVKHSVTNIRVRAKNNGSYTPILSSKKGSEGQQQEIFGRYRSKEVTAKNNQGYRTRLDELDLKERCT